MNARAYLKAIKSIYTLRYALLNIAVFAIYYEAAKQLLALQQFGIIFYTAPMYLIVSVILTASVLMTVAVYTIIEGRKKRAMGYGEAASSGATAIVTGVISGCGCQGALLYSGIAFVAGAGEATLINNVFAEHIGAVLIILTVFNILFIVYSIGRISKPAKR